MGVCRYTRKDEDVYGLCSGCSVLNQHSKRDIATKKRSGLRMSWELQLQIAGNQANVLYLLGIPLQARKSPSNPQSTFKRMEGDTNRVDSGFQAPKVGRPKTDDDIGRSLRSSLLEPSWDGQNQRSNKTWRNYTGKSEGHGTNFWLAHPQPIIAKSGGISSSSHALQYEHWRCGCGSKPTTSGFLITPKQIFPTGVSCCLLQICCGML